MRGVLAILRAQPDRLAAGEGHLDEVAAMAEIRDLADQALDAMVVWLLTNTDTSHRDIADALGVSRQAVARKYRGLSPRKTGGQPWNLR